MSTLEKEMFSVFDEFSLLSSNDILDLLQKHLNYFVSKHAGIAGVFVLFASPVDGNEILISGTRSDYNGTSNLSDNSFVLEIPLKKKGIQSTITVKAAEKSIFSSYSYMQDIGHLVGFVDAMLELFLKNKMLDLLNENFIKSLALVIDSRDPYTCNHSKRVSDFAYKIAKRLGLPQKEVKDIFDAALLHDIGKVSVPDSILFKKSNLTEDEFEIIKLHPVAGAKIVECCSLDYLSRFILYHHEKIDGSGYPFGLSGKDVPLESQIIGICDVYDALTSDRSYRRAYNKRDAMKIIEDEFADKYEKDLFLVLKEVILL